MPAQAPMLQALDDAPITRRYVILSLVTMFGAVLDLFDFFLIAFIVPVIDDEWHLTFGQATAVLLSAGVGAIAGALVWGRLGDRYGRRKPLIAGILTFSVATGLLALAPDDGWWYLALGRIVVGAGVAGVAVIAVPMTLEFTPTRMRTTMVGFVTTATVPIGILMAAALSATLADPLGWRPLFAIGIAPAVLALFVKWYVPESPRWLIDQGRPEEARRSIAYLLMVPEESLSLDVPPRRREPEIGLRQVLRHRNSVLVTSTAWFGASVAVSGLILWGPTFLKEILEIDSDEAALLFVWVTLGSFGGRLFFSFAPARLGRRMCGLVTGLGAAPLLFLAGASGESEVVGVSLFLVALVLASFFVDGGFANLAPLTPELFPTSMRTQGLGLSWAFSGLGRIMGPLVIGTIAAEGNDPIEPQAALDAMLPAFTFLAVASLAAGLVFLLMKVEPHGRDLESLSDELRESAAA
ncbi:MAG TPA: MFS transporter [Thermoleophilaceae bacterium]|jgi:putative MFS transporter